MVLPTPPQKKKEKKKGISFLGPTYSSKVAHPKVIGKVDKLDGKDLDVSQNDGSLRILWLFLDCLWSV